MKSERQNAKTLISFGKKNKRKDINQLNNYKKRNASNWIQQILFVTATCGSNSQISNKKAESPKRRNSRQIESRKY
jgi:hypothetical protein